MNITCVKNELVNALSTVSKAVASKPQTPILSGIYLRAENDELELQATNYELGFILRIKAEVIEPGETIIEGRIFLEIVRKLGETISLKYNSSTRMLDIASDSFTTSLVTMDANDFPKIQPLAENISFVVNDNVLKALIKKTVFACATDEQRPIFTGCSLSVEGNRVTMAATNSHRLAVIYENFDTEIGQIKIIIPARILLDLLSNMKSDVPTPVMIKCTYNQISFEFDNLFMTSRLIEGVFPDYKNVIPKELSTTVTLDTSAFKSALDRVSILSRTSDYNIVKFEFTGDTLVLSSKNPNSGDAKEILPVTIDGPAITIGFNAQYITDVLKNIDGKTCQMKLNKPLSPVIFTDAADANFTYVVTPVRLSVSQ